MNDHELLQQLMTRAALPEAAAREVIHALAGIAREQAEAGRPLDLEALDTGAADGRPHGPAGSEVDRIIALARRHPLGLEFLRHGEPAAVAITLHAHVFDVEAARRRIGAKGAPPPPPAGAGPASRPGAGGA